MPTSTPTPITLSTHIVSVSQYLAVLRLYIETHTSRDDLRQVRLYAGEFDDKEIKKESFNAPAVFISCLGWQPNEGSKKINAKRRTYRARVVMSVVVKHASGRDKRFDAALALCELLTSLVIAWQPTGCVAREVDDLTVENQFDRDTDVQQMAIWTVSWFVDVEIQPAPNAVPVLNGWLGLDIDSTYLTVAPPAAHATGTAPINPEMPAPDVALDHNFTTV